MQDDSDLNKLIKTKLALIDQDCESETRNAVNNLYLNIKYEGGRLCIPDFNKAANLISGVITCKEKRFNSEISRILSTSGGFCNSSELEFAKEFVSRFFEEELYLNRFEEFNKGVELAVRRYGLRLDGQAYRTDLASSLFEVEIKNSARRAVASVHAELTMHLTSDRIRSREYLPVADDIVDLKPNFMGLGINFNALIKWLRARYRNEKT
ncbi:hypothetical protein C9E85_16035 [Plesiomonas shigelloides]|uniref:hypothetical protein n=1 Tax=Plesiomonas shigelloides TaxID=703 RepID=UPI000D5824EE|nr:hypothetical protein [Plesiomonas shigelloides]PVU64852.1 hypothetical protein C9E85_16035 [Plesiomonas shigelloides]